MDQQDGFALLIQAGREVCTAVDALCADDQGPAPEAIAEFVSTHRKSLDLGRSALDLPCVTILRFESAFFDETLERIHALRALARGFQLEFLEADQCQDDARAIKIGLTLFKLANTNRRDGLVVSALTSNGFEGLALKRLYMIRHRLTVPAAQQLASELLRIECEREPITTICARDRAWETIVYGPKETRENPPIDLPVGEDIDPNLAAALSRMIHEFSAAPTDEQDSCFAIADNRVLAFRRLLIIELAVQAFRGTHHADPESLEQLVPEFLPALPLDPYTGSMFVTQYDQGALRVGSPGPKLLELTGISAVLWAQQIHLSLEEFDNP